MASEDVAESYRSPLEELKMNSKPQISMLTMLAEDHEQNAPEIVRVIQEQILKVYMSFVFVLDSIMLPS